MIGDAVGLGILWILGFLFLSRVPPLPTADGRPLPRVSIIIPARDEARNLPVLFASLEQQSLRPLEIIVVDDHSEDETAQISRARGARVVSPPPLPEGWLGKNHACWQGAVAARGELFVFLDSDTRLEDDGLRRLIETQVVRGGFVSVQPYHRMDAAYERLSAFFAFIVMGGIRAFTVLGERLPPRGLFGPAIACRREDYFAIDGHRAVKADVLEDVELGRTAAEAGYALNCFAGRGSISFRMDGGSGGRDSPARRRLARPDAAEAAARAGRLPALRGADPLHADSNRKLRVRLSRTLPVYPLVLCRDFRTISAADVAEADGPLEGP